MAWLLWRLLPFFQLINANPTCPLRRDYHSLVVDINAEFWKPGVEKSKDVLDDILSKIAKVETNHKITAVVVEEKQSQLYPKKGKVFMAARKSGLHFILEEPDTCSELSQVQFKVENDFDLGLSCLESELLYGINNQKLYEPHFCRNEPVLEELSVAWDLCLAHHYPWVKPDRICVIKSTYGEFVACFCDTDDKYILRRGFCISKLECFNAKVGVNILPGEEQNPLGTECQNQLDYLLGKTGPCVVEEDNALDRLRSIPYSESSPCYRHHNFSALFDIGQLTLDELDSQIQILTPAQQEAIEGPRVEEVHQEKKNPLRAKTKQKKKQKKKTIMKKLVTEEPVPTEPEPEKYVSPLLEPKLLIRPVNPIISKLQERLKPKLAVNVIVTFLLGIPHHYLACLYTHQSIQNSRYLRFFQSLMHILIISFKSAEMWSVFPIEQVNWYEAGSIIQHLSIGVSFSLLLNLLGCLRSDVVNQFWGLSFLSILMDITVVTISTSHDENAQLVTDAYHVIRLMVDGVFGIYFIYNIKIWPRPDDDHLQNKQTYKKRKKKAPPTSTNPPQNPSSIQPERKKKTETKAEQLK